MKRVSIRPGQLRTSRRIEECGGEFPPKELRVIPSVSENLETVFIQRFPSNAVEGLTGGTPTSLDRFEKQIRARLPHP